MICNTDGESTWFDGSYPFELYPRDQTVHGSFRFHNAVIEEQLGAVVLVVTRWTDAEGVTWTIPESERLHRQWTNLALFTEDIAIPDQE